ncbi:putative trans-2-enoyl-CoA reductase 2, mitochondrial [Ceratocystis fimbriata CBS 114723]|uniref:enoyl-[acyl-carrier-protein] reductase n=1 Tax=Ceratocystis fimbriata CBS 114723 TaxID=1035309 RepID=A0A2C5WXX9_9PEZI|nr:putative trans-2-enoyl-CoA reductase 2, mitochondrial [Ceratocystis fimbriata CBS 114723]
MPRPTIANRALPRLLPRVFARWKSGPYGYTQAKSLVYSKTGNPGEVLHLHAHSISPTIPSSQVLLRTLAAPINPADINTVQGTYGIKPAFSQLIGTSEPSAIPGNEAVFEVLSAGSGVSHLSPGDWVIPASSGFGTWRTHVLADASTLMPIDKTGLTTTQAATVSVNPSTAYRLLRLYGPQNKPQGTMTPLAPNSGSWFVQNGANSGVGRAAIQLGRLWGLRSINVVRERATPAETEALKAELKELGATVVVTDAEFTAREWSAQLAEILGKGEEVGLGLNCVGGKSLTAMARTLGYGGSLVTYGAMAARERTQVPAGLMIFKDIRLLGFWLTRWNQTDAEGRRITINDILELMRQGRFVDVPYIEQKWEWDTGEKELAGMVQNGLEGFRGGKGIFMFGET